MSSYQRKPNRFLFLGVVTAAAGDSISEGNYQIAKNIRSYEKGVIQSRAGMSAINSSAISAIHSIKRLNNDLPTASQAFARFLGNGSALHSDNSAHTAFTSRATGFSGNPLSMVPFKPLESPEPYLYVADSLKMGKAKVDGTFQNLGISRPIVAPTTQLTKFDFNVFGSLSTGAAAGWSAGGTATVSATNQSRINTTITRIVYDSGSTGWASVQPASFQEINRGCRITFDVGGGNVEQCLIEEVFEKAHDTTVAAIEYDTGTTGNCSIVLTSTSKTGLRKDACLLINTEIVRIIDVIEGPNGSISIRAFTSGAHAAAESVTGLATFRCFTLNTQVAGNTITETVHRLSVTVGIGQYNNTVAIDASIIGNRPMTPNDFIHIGIKMDVPGNLTEGKLLLDVDAATNDFTKNYYFFSFNANDFTPAVNDEITTLLAKQKKIQNNLIELQNRHAKQAKIDRVQNKLDNIAARLKQLQELATTPPLGIGADSAARFETVSGASQWTEFFIRLDANHLTRVGSDTSRGLANIAKIRLQFNVTDTTVIDVADFYVGGGCELEVTPVGTPYIWRYRYRSSTTGARSAFSPPMRTGIVPRRQKVTLTPTTSSDAQVDKIDWIRFGGTLNRWIYVGTQANSGTFIDDKGDASILGYPEIDVEELYQPFVIQFPPTTMVANVVGTSVVFVSGDTFPLQMIEGTPIIINGVQATLHSQLDPFHVYVKEDFGSLSNVNVFIPSPESAAQPLPIIFGPYLEGQYGSVMFACGDPYNPGTLYWTNPDNPDGMKDTNFIEVCSPSEQLMSGGLLDGKAFIFSAEKLYWIYPRAFGNSLSFYTEDSGCHEGLIGRWGLDVSKDQIFFVGKDGIYVTQGGMPTRITDAIYQVFPHDGQVGVTVNGLVAPDYANPQTFQLEYGDSYLFFDYLGIDGLYHTLVGDLKVQGVAWSQDEFSPTVRKHYFEEGKGVHNLLMGGSDGRLYSNSGTGDGAAGSTPISVNLRTHAEDGGDARSKKRFGDVLFDYDPQGVAITAEIALNNYSNPLVPTTVLNATAGRRQQVVDIASGEGEFARNLTSNLSWSSAVATPKLYLWEPSFSTMPEDTVGRRTPTSSQGTLHAKFVQGIRIRANTYNQEKSFAVLSDNAGNGQTVQQQTFVLRSNGDYTQAFAFQTPFICHEAYVMGKDSVPWSLFDFELVWEPVPEIVKFWEAQETTFDLQGFLFVRDLYIAHVSNTDLTLHVIIDGDGTYVYVIPNGAGKFLKSYVPLKARKGKFFKFRLFSDEGFRLFLRDSEVHVGQWNRGSNGMITAKPFGDFSREHGALI